MFRFREKTTTDFEKEINDYIDNTLPGVIQTEVNKQIIQFAINTYYSEEDHSLNFGIDTGTVVYDAVHYIDDETLNHGTVTLRDRDTMEQNVLKLEEVPSYIEERIKF